VRSALSLALPWEEMRKDYFLPAKTLIFPLPDYPQLDGVTETDIEQAKKLLSLAGYPEGKGLPTLVIRLSPGEDAARIGTLMSETWLEQLGVPCKVEVVPYSKYFNSLKEPGYVVGATTWIGDFADPYTFLQMWRSDSNLNDARHNDSDYEALLDKSMTQEGTERWKTLSEAEKLLLERGTVLPLAYSPAINIVDTDELGGWYTNALDIHPFKYIVFKDFKPLPGVALAQ
jgi:peptide/nickel transport system substrate-binding protein/oligopeptide transport system substrate-binding protein